MLQPIFLLTCVTIWSYYTFVGFSSVRKIVLVTFEVFAISVVWTWWRLYKVRIFLFGLSSDFERYVCWLHTMSTL